MTQTLPIPTGKWLLISFLCTHGVFVAGQHRALPPPQIGIGLSACTYLGDMNPALSATSLVNPGLDLSLQFPGRSLIGPELHAGVGRLIAQAPPSLGSPSPVNTFVQTDFSHVDFRLHLLLFRKYKFSPFCAAGAGILIYAPKDKDGYLLIDNAKTRAAYEDYSGIAAFFPLSAGFRYQMSQRTSLTVEGTLRRTRTDYLDNIGQLGSIAGNDQILSVTTSCNIRLGDFYLRKMEQQIHKQEREVVASLPAALLKPAAANNKIALMTRQAIDAHRFVYYRARKGEDPDSMALRTGLDKEVLRQLNYLPESGPLPEAFNMRVPNIWYLGVKKAFPEAYLTARIEAREFLYYSVSPGDSFAALSERYGVPDAVLRKINFVLQGEPESGSLLRLPLLYAQ